MTFDTAYLHYRSGRKIAKAASVTSQAVSLWKKKGIIPRRSALLLEALTKGAIKVDESVYESKG